MNKVTLGLVLLVALLGFLLLTTDNGCMASKRPLEVSSVVGSSNTATVEVSASESHKYEANEFLTVARLELHGKDKELLFKQLTSRRFSIFEQMRVLEISEADIEQNSIEMRKEWSYDKGTRSLTGYVVSQSFAIKSSSRSVAAAAVAALSAEMDVEIDYTSATLKNSLASYLWDYEADTSIHAVGKKALEKAENYAASVGGKLGKVIAVRDDDSGSDSYVRRHEVFVMAKGGDDAVLSSVADSVEISASIHLVVELLQ